MFNKGLWWTVVMGGKKRNKSSPATGNLEKRSTLNSYKHSNMSQQNQPGQPIASSPPQPQAQAMYAPGTPFPSGPIPAPGYYSPTQQFISSPLPQPTQQHINLQYIQDKLESIDMRLRKLDTIENQLSSLSSKLNTVENRVTSLERTVTENNTKLLDIETSRNVDAQICSDLESKQTSIEKQLKEERARVAELSRDVDELKKSNCELSEEIIDTQARTMRDNLLFFGLGEYTTEAERQKENCMEKVLTFCSDVLQIENASQMIKLDRAHRIGGFTEGKKRPIVAKFNYHQDKLTVKQKAYEVLKGSPFRVSDQFPRVIQERRKELYPMLVQARRENKRAFLSYDTLHINGQKIKAPSVSGTGNK